MNSRDTKNITPSLPLKGEEDDILADHDIFSSPLRGRVRVGVFLRRLGD